MADKRKPLEPWQQDDAARLKALFDAKWHSSQDAFGEAFDLGSQGNVWQYLNARTPLNIGAVVRFAQGLNCRIEEISPTLAAELARVPASAYVLRDSGTTSYEEAILVDGFRVASDDRREDMLELARKALRAASLSRRPAHRDGLHRREFGLSRSRAVVNDGRVIYPDVSIWTKPKT